MGAPEGRATQAKGTVHAKALGQHHAWHVGRRARRPVAITTLISTLKALGNHRRVGTLRLPRAGHQEGRCAVIRLTESS